jgi:hypothetical protein
MWFVFLIFYSSFINYSPGQIGDQSELPLPGPGDAPGPKGLTAWLLAWAPAWFSTGKNEYPPEAIGNQPFPLCAAAFSLPTEGYRKLPSGLFWSAETNPTVPINPTITRDITKRYSYHLV